MHNTQRLILFQILNPPIFSLLSNDKRALLARRIATEDQQCTCTCALPIWTMRAISCCHALFRSVLRAQVNSLTIVISSPGTSTLDCYWVNQDMKSLVKLIIRLSCVHVCASARARPGSKLYLKHWTSAWFTHSYSMLSVLNWVLILQWDKTGVLKLQLTDQISSLSHVM